MLIWILAVLVFALTAALGRFQGAIRLLVSLVGLVLATLLAFPLASVSSPIVGWIGVKSVFWAWALPPLINFFVIYFVGIGVAYAVHRKVELYYKYRADDVSRLRWERVNERLGISLGLATGAVWILVLGLGVYIAGYPTVQLSADDNASGAFKLLNIARRDLHSTGLDKTVARFDSTPARYYEASDILGLIYNNPILISRLAQYPTFLLSGERPEYQEIANDKDYMSLLLGRSDINQLLSNPKTQAVINNPEILQELNRQDLKDLRFFLETGKTPKFDDEKILGRWGIDLDLTVAREKKKRPDMSATEMNRLKKTAQLMSGISFVATTDNRAILKVDLSEAQKLLLQAAQAPPPAAVAQAPATPSISPDIARRYGIAPGGRGGPGGRAGGGGGGAVAPVAPPKPNPNAITQPVFSAQGTWKLDGDKYQISLQDEKGKQQTVEAQAEDGRLFINLPNTTLILAKVE